MNQSRIPIRELHARTGQHVRRAASGGRIVVTERGVPVAELRALPEGIRNGRNSSFGARPLQPAFAAICDEPVGGTDSTKAVTEDRDRG